MNKRLDSLHRAKHFPRRHLTLAVAVVLSLAFASLWSPSQQLSAKRQNLSLTLKPSLELTKQTGETDDTPALPQPANTEHWEEITVRKGDSLSSIFSRNQLSASELYKFANSGKQAADLKYIKPGDQIELIRSSDNKLVKFKYHKSTLVTQLWQYQDKQFKFSELVRKPEIKITFRESTIKQSLYLSSQKAAISDNITMQLADIFAWEIDFIQDIRAGDQFSLTYEEKYLDGEKIGEGRILAARFVNRGEEHFAVLYTDNKGRSNYYNPEGKSLKKAFTRYPVDFTRISSRFTRARKHPILHKIRAHNGVDYAASYGTPIKATSDGKITFAGKKGGYGNTVVIQHRVKYTTLYAHMKHFSRGIRAGKKVKQGQIIGYVGSSGLATGPHLHYEFRVHNVHRDPLKVKLPHALPITASEKSNFKKQSSAVLAQLAKLQNASTFALNP
ncbi:MAG: peptidoglycan DD-metalloendopeptidase family protein [Pseudomonadales bacterium]|nr:peptidoglycan DD-metalloendopeptidase family protein [Pseudomonadales bacterium]